MGHSTTPPLKGEKKKQFKLCVLLTDLSPGLWFPQRASTGECSPPPSPSPRLPSSPSCTPPEMTGWGSRGCHEESKSHTPKSPWLLRPWAYRELRELRKRKRGEEWCQPNTDITHSCRHVNLSVSHHFHHLLVAHPSETEMQKRVRSVSQRCPRGRNQHVDFLINTQVLLVC